MPMDNMMGGGGLPGGISPQMLQMLLDHLMKRKQPGLAADPSSAVRPGEMGGGFDPSSAVREDELPAAPPQAPGPMGGESPMMPEQLMQLMQQLGLPVSQ